MQDCFIFQVTASSLKLHELWKFIILGVDLSEYQKVQEKKDSPKPDSNRFLDFTPSGKPLGVVYVQEGESLGSALLKVSSEILSNFQY